MNKEALTEALDRPDGLYPRPDQFLLIEAAARLVERLLPGECECSCHDGGSVEYQKICTDCDGSGQVWDEGSVEVVAKVIYDGDKANLKPTDPFVAWDLVILERQRSPWHKQARAVLSALAQPSPPAGG